MNKQLTGIIPFNYVKSKISGSSFLRAECLCRTSSDFKLWKHGADFDNLIFQKVYWTEMMELFKGPKILDLADPDWINGDVDLMQIGSMVDGITCSSPGLTELVRNYLPGHKVFHIPDRFDFDSFPAPRSKHTAKAKHVVWFGFIANAHETLPSLARTLKKHNLKLTIVSNFPYTTEDEVLELDPTFINYTHEEAYAIIKQSDIVLNPKSCKGFYKYKSNNKSIIAYKLGVPVAENESELERLLLPQERNNDIIKHYDRVTIEYDIRNSHQQYRDIFNMIRQ